MPALLYGLLSAPFGWLATAFWIWMIVDCLKNGSGRERQWIWLLIFLNVLGAVIYFVVCWWPRSNHKLPMPSFAKRFAAKDKLWQAEADARNIGKAYQFVRLGELLYSLGDRAKAQNAYDEAIAQEPNNQQALWGLANLAMDRKDWPGAKERLTLLLQEDPNFKNMGKLLLCMVNCFITSVKSTKLGLTWKRIVIITGHRKPHCS